MRPSTFSSTALAAAALTNVATALGNGTYTLKDDLSYKKFFQNFNFFSGPDPTKGFVQYQDMDAAIQSELVGYFDDTQTVYLGVDFKEKDPKGRKSVRLESTKTWNQGLLVADIRHMPDSTCGSWPAFWALGTNANTAGNADAAGNSNTDSDGPGWPFFGEVDILEGVNGETENSVTLHTSAGCAMENITLGTQGRNDAALPYLGSMVTENCDVNDPNQAKNAGCSIKAPPAAAKNGMATYGTDFNNAGGGVYAMEWTSESISVWFFPRNSSTFASTFSTFSATKDGAENSTQTLDPSTWGTPLAKFQGQGCDFTERFKNMQVIFDTTFCGEWAGKVWRDSCAAKTGVKTCQEYVQNNPDVFADAYWEIAGLKWFEKQGGSGAQKRAFRNVKQPGRSVRW